MLTFGIVAAALTGLYYIHQAEAAITAAAGDPTLIRARPGTTPGEACFYRSSIPASPSSSARSSSAKLPGGCFAKAVLPKRMSLLRRASSDEEAAREMNEMQELALEDKRQGGAHSGSLLQRKYVVPLVLGLRDSYAESGHGNQFRSPLSHRDAQAGWDVRHPCFTGRFCRQAAQLPDDNRGGSAYR